MTQTLDNRLPLPVGRCEVDEADPLEQASPVPDVVVERNEEFYDQSYVNDKENTASEVSWLGHAWLHAGRSRFPDDLLTHFHSKTRRVCV